jgi:hypothetical protein
MHHLPALARRGLSSAALVAVAVAVPQPTTPRPVDETPSAMEPVLAEPAIVFDWSDVGMGALGGAGIALVATGGALYLLRGSSTGNTHIDRKESL